MYVPPLSVILHQFVAGRFPTLSPLALCYCVRSFANGTPQVRCSRRGSAQSLFPAHRRLIPISAFAPLGGGDCLVVRRLPWGVWPERDDMRRLRGVFGFRIGRAMRRSVGLDGWMAGTDPPQDSETNSTRWLRQVDISVLTSTRYGGSSLCTSDSWYCAMGKIRSMLVIGNAVSSLQP